MKSAFALTAIVIGTTAFAQEDKPVSAQKKSTSPEMKRGAYVVKYANAKNIAGVLSKHFKQDAEIHAGPESASDSLLINASPAVFEEIVKTIDQLDRPRHSISVDVYLVSLQAKPADDRPYNDKEFAGAVGEVSDRLNAMVKSGQAASVKRIQLGVTEGHLASVMLGENKPFVMGAAMTGRGNVSKQITYRNVGTQVRVTPNVTADGTISLELNIEDSTARPSTTASVGNDEKGAAIPAADFTNTSLNGKIVVADGQAVLANAARSTSKDGQAETLIVVGARIVDSKANRR